MGRFINADEISYLGADGNLVSYNLFVYCNNNPVNFENHKGTSSTAEILQWWLGTMWWLCGVDGVLPFGDLIFSIVTLCLWVHVLTVPQELEMPQILLEVEKEEPEPPDVTYPGDDPTVAPGEDYEWKGQEPVGGDKGTWKNKITGEQLHPDLNHPQPVGPHWDYTNGLKPKVWWRVFQDGTIQLKP